MSAPGRALVTGAAGVIGAHLVRHLAARDWPVRGLDVHALPAPPAGVQMRTLDIRDTQALGQALEGVTHVFNLASVHLDVHATPEDFESVNVRALDSLAAACARAGVRRLVHVSSVGVYGHVAAPPAAEDAPLHPENDYERSKAAGELAIAQAARAHDLDLVIVRPAWAYGLGCPRTAKLIRSLRRGRFFYIGRARNLRHPIFVDDLVRALEQSAVGGPELRGRIFNLAGPRWMTVQEMVSDFAQAAGVRPPTLHAPRWLGLCAGLAAEHLSGLLGREPPISRRTLAFFENDNAFDIRAARSAFGFDPRVDLSEGARAVAGALN